MADIIRMADEANLETFEEETMRFAALVYEAGAEAEREACVEACDEASRPIYIAEVTMPDPDEHNKVYPGFIASEIRARRNK